MSKEIVFIPADRLKPPAGISTGLSPLDRFLLWKGFPKGSISLMVSPPGLGATTLWMQSAAKVSQQGLWVAWINGPRSNLTPWSLRHRQVDLSKLLCISTPRDLQDTLWCLQETMALSLFETVACDLGEQSLKEHQILKLKRSALRYQTALVLITSNRSVLKSSFYSLILSFEKDQILIDRALHRPTPHTIERRELYADTLPQLASGRKALGG